MNPEITEHLNWAINTIRDKVMFGRDELGAALARETRAKGVMIDAVKYIQTLEKEIIFYRHQLEYAAKILEDVQADKAELRKVLEGGKSVRDL